MHIPDVLIDPRASIATMAIGAAGLAYGLRRVEERHGERATSLMGMTAAFVFAAQMVNFPVGPGVSGHLLGGVLSAVILGPWAGAVVIAAVLIVQCLLFQDGGVTALGANFLNMGLIGSVGGYAVYAPIRRALGGRRGILIGSMIAAWFSVLLAAGAFSIELAAGAGREGFFRILSWMALVHAAIGVGEALITGLVVRFVLLTRPELIEDEAEAPAGRPTRWAATAVAGLGIALGVAVFASPFAWDAPDGLEFVGAKFGFLPDAEAPPIVQAPMPDYQAPLPTALTPFDQVKTATAAAGLVGTLVVFAFAWSMARVFASRDADAERMLVDAA
ncbi:energy-coupling factor ABC transporter permease [Paludisphaera mucosa]|uniref:Energy-coupling factor ABC transporter permease n=1 Tax=Paludisphaera mucosa TaxID=3030827 RepID=A0ABT6FDQ6_9BACT|nr:energy-coupling factor ABC transporter permease [Paludisphaera mucosa]MDG3005672.1 energy-coupling factor ABC transporter permease [Paludisphaera mucosa]